MSVWLSKLLQDWRILASDPVSITGGAIIAIGIVAGILYWSYASLGSWTSSFLDDTSSGLTELHAGYKTLKKPLRDPNALYRDGQRIGAVLKPDVDVPKGDVKFQDVKTDGELDRTTPFEFQDLILTYKGCDVSERIRKGDEVSF
jgi:hypothetical protein